MECLFTDSGPDPSNFYDVNATFVDPLSSHSSLSSFLSALKLLRAAFGPELVIHELRRTNNCTMMCRWTMRMTLQFLKRMGALRQFWDPEMIFTGVSVMKINPRTGRCCSCIDHWDAVDDRSYPSFAAMKNVHVQMWTLSQASRGLEVPQHTVMRRYADCDVRRYAQFEVVIDEAGGPARAVVGTSSQAALTGGYASGLDSRRLQQRRGHFAAVSFPGVADEQQVEKQVQRLRCAMAAHRLRPKSEEYLVAELNVAGTLPYFRKNEVLIELASFELW